MSLRERIVVILFIIFCVYAGLEYLAYHHLIYPVFVQQEQQQARTATENARTIIERQFADIQQQVTVKARSGALHPLLKARSEAFQNPFERVDIVILYDYRWNRRQVLAPSSLTVEDFEQRMLAGDDPFLTKSQMGFSKRRIVSFDDRHLLMVAEPILASPNSTAVEGMVLTGKLLTDKWIHTLRKTHDLDFNWSFLSSAEQRSRNAETIVHFTPENAYRFTPLSNDYLECATILYDANDQPVLLLKTLHDKSVSSHGKATLDKLILFKLACGLTAILLLTILLQITVIAPLKKLIKHVARFGQQNAGCQKIALARNDEIGKLAREFEHMCGRLKNAQIKLMEKSYVSGAAEMSSGILHNVRNALSPITTQLERIKDQFHGIPLENLEQARVELQSGSLSPQRREDLLRFVDLTFQHVLDSLQDMVAGLEELSTQVVQIEDMLNTKRTFGGQKDKLVEFIEPSQLLHNALEIIPQEVREKNRIHISGAIKKLPSIPVHPTTFFQILQNLLINAAESLDREKPLCRRITVECRIEEAEPVDVLHWTIKDNGIGIEPDKIETIFERGASSKARGLTGIGLHWCANTINAMQGRLWAESAGEHRGAIFHLLVPMAAEEALTKT